MSKNGYPRPTCRRLRVYSLDPSLEQSLDTLDINTTVMSIRWEDLHPGPIGEYIEVIDYDPASGCYYTPIDLDDSGLLAQDGLTPFEGDPQFHQQMVYAVAMKTIANFEFALGRKMLWSPYVPRDAQGQRQGSDQFVRRLRIYPHALREANAYYSPQKKALLFGYFNARTKNPAQHLPGGVVFTCLSHDVVAHETTHALLDGQHERLLEPTNADVLAFHEAFADIVAIFQHFTMPDVLRHQIGKTRGDLGSSNLLAQLAVQFGRANARDALRDALENTAPDPSDLDTTHEPHERGAILVAAVFEAFVLIYRRRVADLLRISSGGTGVLAEGALHPDLVNRLAKEASRAAQHVLNMCIRALDYLPPVDLTFGDYLRALITCDYDLVRDDDLGYRVAFINAFSRRGIYPRDVRALSVSSLAWERPSDEACEFFKRLLPDPRVLKKMVDDWGQSPLGGGGALDPALMSAENPEQQLRAVVDRYLKTEPPGPTEECCADNEEIDRGILFSRSKYHAMLLHYFIKTKWELIQDEKRGEQEVYNTKQVAAWTGLKLAKGKKFSFEVHAVRPVHRVGPDGQLREHLLVIITQRLRKRLQLDPLPHEPGAAAAPEDDDASADNGLSFDFYGGCTLLIDSRAGCVRYCILKNIDNDNRQQRQEEFLRGRLDNAAFDARAQLGLSGGARREPLAMLHRTHGESEEWA